MTYRPLPPYVTIKESEIEGFGLFATEDIDAGFRIGLTHIQDNRFQNGYIRTPLGGFFNHSEEPNCEIKSDIDFLFLYTKHKILAGEELTATYTLYKPNK